MAITLLKISCIHESVGNLNGTVQQSEQGSEGEVECLDEHEDVNGVDKKRERRKWTKRDG